MQSRYKDRQLKIDTVRHEGCIRRTLPRNAGLPLAGQMVRSVRANQQPAFLGVPHRHTNKLVFVNTISSWDLIWRHTDCWRWIKYKLVYLYRTWQPLLIMCYDIYIFMFGLYSSDFVKFWKKLIVYFMLYWWELKSSKRVYS